ncbi:hypothetical protein J7K42_01380 [bacterium]|nr:hypothetical protein [bacterium]
MRKKSIKKIVSKISEGMFDKVLDLVLFGVYYSAEMSPFSGGSLYQRFSRIERDFGKLNSGTLKRALQRAQQKGWLNAKLEVTPRGQKRLEEILPKYEKAAKWNGNWYIVGYDIPESKRYLRDILRDNLEKLGFGQYHKSLYISPFNFLGDIEKIVKQYRLSSYVLLAVSNKLGREPSKELAERIWKLRELNDEYKEYIRKVKSKKLTKQQAIFKYLVILNRDPKLPQDLLPEDWKGEQARRIYKKLAFWKRFPTEVEII